MSLVVIDLSSFAEADRKEFKTDFRRVIGLRQEIVRDSRRLASMVEKASSTQKAIVYSGAGVNLAGCAATITCGAITMAATGGLAATAVPFLMYGGTGLGVAGSLTKVAGVLNARGDLNNIAGELESLKGILEEEGEVWSRIEGKLDELDEGGRVFILKGISANQVMEGLNLPQENKITDDVVLGAQHCVLAGLMGLNMMGHIFGVESVERFLTMALPPLFSFLQDKVDAKMLLMFNEIISLAIEKGLKEGIKQLAIPVGFQEATKAVDAQNVPEGLAKKKAQEAAAKTSKSILKESEDDIAKGFLTEISDDVTSKAAEELVKKGVRKATKEAAKKGVEKGSKVSAEEVAKEISKEAAKKGAKEAAKKGANEAAKKGAAKAAEGAAKDAARLVAKVTGGISVGIGSASAAWEIYQLVKKAKEKNELGEQLAAFADDVEKSLESLQHQQREPIVGN